jgi:hypothetical protein
MPRRSKRRGPSTPEEIAARAALRRGQIAAAEREGRRNPAMWGIAQKLAKTPANEDMEIVLGHAGKVKAARRSDAFTLVDMSGEQRAAARRYERDWMIRAGVRIDDPPMVVESSPGLAPGQATTQRMIDAGHRIEDVHREVGRLDAKLLIHLMESVVMRGEVRVWRVLVQQATGETDRHVQGARVRQACENLRLAYEALEAGWRQEDMRRKAIEDRRRAAERSRFAGGSA